jgi:hypothetical protein
MPDAATLGLGVAIASNEGYGNNSYKPSRYNNPGDIKAPWSGYPSDTAGITQFPDIQTGQQFLNHQASLILNGSANYNPQMTIGEAAAKYTDNGANAGANWAKTLDPSGTLVTQDTTLAQYRQLVASGALTPPTQLPNPAANNGPAPTVSAPVGNQAPPDPGDLPSRDTAAVPAQSLDPQTVSAQTYAQLNPDLIVKEGLDVTPWYRDQGLLTGNPRIRKFVAPISFKMLIQGTPLSTEGSSGDPIEVQLNASVKSYSKTSKHIFNKTNSRTGIHLTFWGQQADIIEAQCTTGIFMNQLGLTDFFSTAVVNDDLVRLLNDGFEHTQEEDTGDVEVAQGVVQQKTYGGLSSFRVAAQDAFVELLSLFKSNGNVWYRNDNYTGALSEQDQAGVSAWSPKTGLSTQQGNARVNDVMTRGFIAMQLKESTYLGYFKSLSWTQDANNPFQWNFNFVFQVERTVSLLEYPR